MMDGMKCCNSHKFTHYPVWPSVILFLVCVPLGIYIACQIWQFRQETIAAEQEDRDRANEMPLKILKAWGIEPVPHPGQDWQERGDRHEITRAELRGRLAEAQHRCWELLNKELAEWRNDPDRKDGTRSVKIRTGEDGWPLAPTTEEGQRFQDYLLKKISTDGKTYGLGAGGWPVPAAQEK